MTQTNYGFLSDMHRAPPETAVTAAKVLKQLGADALIYNGDLVGDQHTQDKQAYFAQVLTAGLETNLPVFVQPGSHEEVGDVLPVIADVSSRFPNLVDTLTNPKHEARGHHLVFLPCSDFRAGGQFALEATGETPDGIYLQGEQELIPVPPEQYDRLMRHPQASKALLHLTNIDHLDKLVTDPGKTIVVCHVPRRFTTVEHSVDHAYFAQRLDGQGLVPGIMLEEQIRAQAGDVSAEQLEAIAQQNGFTFKRENRGNDALTEAYSRIGITKAPTGHFHESVHRATDASGNPLAENTLSLEHFWMASYIDAGLVGMLTVDDAKVSHRNIDLIL